MFAHVHFADITLDISHPRPGRSILVGGCRGSDLIRVMKIGRDGNPVLSDTYLGGGFKYFLCSPLFEEDSHVETTNQLLCIGVS